MLKHSAAVVAIILFLVTPGTGTVRTVGFSPGDSAIFNYDIRATNVNSSSHTYFVFRVDILSVNTSKPIGEVGYMETLTDFNGTIISKPSASQNTTSRDLTAIFDPFNNATYLAKIGFHPFTFTDVPAGSKYNMTIGVPFAGFGGRDQVIYVNATVNATVARSPASIDVTYSVKSDPRGLPWGGVMHYDPKTGMLVNGTQIARFLETTRVFNYQLLQFDHPTPLDLSFLPYLIVAGLAVFVVYSVAARGSAKDRKVGRIKKRFGRKP